jgi:hypothetical protein
MPNFGAAPSQVIDSYDISISLFALFWCGFSNSYLESMTWRRQSNNPAAA